MMELWCLRFRALHAAMKVMGDLVLVAPLG
jgi:hypothetical protein